MPNVTLVAGTPQPSTAFELDASGYIVFPTDKLSNNDLIDFLYNQVFLWFEATYPVKLTDLHKAYIKDHYQPMNAKRYLQRDVNRYLPNGSSTSETSDSPALPEM